MDSKNAILDRLINKYMEDGYEPVLWSETQQISGFGGDAGELLVNWDIPKDCVTILTHADFVQWLTANVGTAAFPTNVILPNAGLITDGAVDIYGINFRHQWKTNQGSRDYDSGYRFSSQLSGPLFTTYNFVVPFRPKAGTKITCKVTPLTTQAAGDTYEAHIVLNGFQLIKA